MSILNKHTWVNGLPQGTVSVFDRGLAFGDGLFETIAIQQGAVPLLELHLDRLLSSAAVLGISISRAQVVDDIAIALTHSQDQHDGNWRLKYILTRGESDSGYMPNPRNLPTRIMHLMPHDAGLVRLLQQQGIKACTCQWRLSHQPALAGLKHLNRLDQIKGRQELVDSDCFEGFMKDLHGNYIEGTMTNFFAVAPDGEMITPSLEHAGVSGVMRRLVMQELAPAINKQCFEAEVHRMTDFAEIFITNAMIGIVPVVAVDQKMYPIGELTRKLQQQLQTYLRNT